MANELHWFPLDAEDWLNSETVSCMSLIAQGIYMRMLCREWLNQSLPADLPKIARVINVEADLLQTVWEELQPCFFEDGGRLYNARLEADRAKQQAKVEKLRGNALKRHQQKHSNCTAKADANEMQKLCYRELDIESSNKRESVSNNLDSPLEDTYGAAAAKNAGAREKNNPEPAEPELHESGFGWQADWWHQHPDRLMPALMDAIAAMPLFRQKAAPAMLRMEQLLRLIRSFAPDEEAIRAQLPLWQSYCREHPKKTKPDPVDSLTFWFEKMRPDWSRSRAPVPSAARRHSETSDETVQRMMKEAGYDNTAP